MSEGIVKNYYAIIPANVRYDKRLKANAKLLYGEITALTNDKGYCWAQNSYFSELYDVEINTVSAWINQLKKYGYISVHMKYREGTNQIEERRIELFDSGAGGITKNREGYHEKTGGGITKNREDNNTINNTDIILPLGHQKNKYAVKKELVKSEELFNTFWTTYGKPVGKKQTICQWNKLKDPDIQSVIKSLVNYIADRPDKKYRSDPVRYLRNRIFEDYQESTSPVTNKKTFKDYA